VSLEASVATVGLSLSEDLIGLTLSLWACFAKFQEGSSSSSNQFRTRWSYRLRHLLASLGPPASHCEWRSWSRGWSLEWVLLCFVFLYFYFKLPRHAVQWRPHANQVLVGVQRVLLLFDVLWSIYPDSVEVRL